MEKTKDKCGICNSPNHNSKEHTDKLMFSEKTKDEYLKDKREISWLEMAKVTIIILLVIIGVSLFELLFLLNLHTKIIVP